MRGGGGGNFDIVSDDVIGIVADYGRRIASPVTSVALWQKALKRACDPDNAFRLNQNVRNQNIRP